MEDLMYWTSSSGRLELKMTLAQAQSVSHSGQCYPDVITLMRVPAVARQLSKLDAALLASELKEYGAWDATELSNHQDNLERVLWLAGCDIAEEAYNAHRND